MTRRDEIYNFFDTGCMLASAVAACVLFYTKDIAGGIWAANSAIALLRLVLLRTKGV